MRRNSQYVQGFRHAAKTAVTWLQREAASMGDPHARTILNNAAFHLGVTLKQLTEGTEEPPEEIDGAAM